MPPKPTYRSADGRRRGRETGRIRFIRRTPQKPKPPAAPLRGCAALDHVLRSERLLLCRPAERDVDAFLASADAEVRRVQGYDDAAVEAARAAFLAAASSTDGACPELLGVYDEEHGGRFAGRYSIERGDDPVRATLGWWLGPESRGRGLGRESLRLVIAYAHDHLWIPVLEMGTSAGNRPALAQIEAVGAEPTGRGPHRLPNGETVEAVWFQHRAVAEREEETT